jgi:hypothetical protein
VGFVVVVFVEAHDVRCIQMYILQRMEIRFPKRDTEVPSQPASRLKIKSRGTCVCELDYISGMCDPDIAFAP